MYSFSEHERHLLFLDAFGLTRLLLPDRALTRSEISGSDGAGLTTVARDGSLAVSYSDGSDKVVAWDLDEMRPVARFERSSVRGAVLSPDGQSLLQCQGSTLSVRSLVVGSRLPMRLDRPTPRVLGDPTSFPLQGGRQLPPITLGRQLPHAPAPLRIAADGTFTVVGHGVVFGGGLQGQQPTLHWQRRITTRDRSRLEVYADAQRVVFVVRTGEPWTVIDGDRRLTVRSLATPVRAGRWLVYQPDQATVVRQDLSSGRQAAFPLEPEHQGPGTIFAGHEALWFLPEHRESVVDLIHGAVVSRELPADQREIRTTLRGLVRPYLRAARARDVQLELKRIELFEHTISLTYRGESGPGLVESLLLQGAMDVFQQPRLPPPWRMGSYGGSGGGYRSVPTAAEIAQATHELQRAGVPFSATLGSWAQRFQREAHAWGSPEPATDAAGAALLLRMVLALVSADRPEAPVDVTTLRSARTPHVDQARRILQRYPARSADLPRSLAGLLGSLVNRAYGAEAVSVWIELLGRQDWPDGDPRYELYTHGIEPLLSAHPEVAPALRRWLERHPLPRDHQWWRAQLYQRLGMEA